MEPEKTPSSGQNEAASPLSGMLSALLANPEMLRQIQAVFGNAATATPHGKSAQAENAGDPSSGSASAAEVGSQPDEASAGRNPSDALVKLLAGLSENGAAASGSDSGAVPTGGGIGDGLSAVLANPDLMAKLPQMMAVLGPMLGGNDTKPPSPHSGHERSQEDCRNDLLLALKPFLSPERRNAVDAILRISKLGNVLRQMK